MPSPIMYTCDVDVCGHSIGTTQWRGPIHFQQGKGSIDHRNAVLIGPTVVYYWKCNRPVAMSLCIATCQQSRPVDAIQGNAHQI